MTAIIQFADDENGGTTYTTTVRHGTPEASQGHEDMGFYDASGTVATQLVKYAQSLQVKKRTLGE